MRISDWSSDVCSSDLRARVTFANGASAEFSLKGSASVIPAEVCTPDVYSTASAPPSAPPVPRPDEKPGQSDAHKWVLDIRVRCTEEWKTDYRMIEYCEKRQMKGLQSVLQIARDETKGASSEEHTSELQSLLTTSSA